MSAGEYYSHGTYPATRASLSSSAMRAELELIEAGFAKLPDLSGNGGKIVAVNAGATALEAVTTTGTGNAVRATSPTFAGATLFGDGTVGAPGIAFSGDTDSGLYRIGANNVGVAVNGAKVLDVGTGGLGLTGSLTIGGDAILVRDAPNALALRNGASEQMLRIYKSFTGASDYSRVEVGLASGAAFFRTTETGSGTATDIGFSTSGAMYVDAVTETHRSSDGGLTRIVLDDTKLDLRVGQIKFPATQLASADANTLDDYEEGTFTPAINFGGGSTGLTYSYQTGFYTKVGNLVHFKINILLTAKGSSTGNLQLTGLPFTASGTANSTSTANVYGNSLSGVSGSLAMNISIGASTALILQTGTGSAALLNDTNFTNTSQLAVSGTYFV